MGRRRVVLCIVFGSLYESKQSQLDVITYLIQSCYYRETTGKAPAGAWHALIYLRCKRCISSFSSVYNTPSLKFLL